MVSQAVNECVNLDIHDSGVAVITMNRPQQLNAFSVPLCAGMNEAYKLVSENDEVKVVIITGAGKGFSAGGDIGVLYAMNSPANAKWTYDVSTSVVRGAYELEKPVIAALNGAVAGAATALMMACDLIIAVENARFGFNFTNIAFTPDSGCSYFLTQKVGYHKAAEILWYGKVLNTTEAAQLGLVNTVVPDGEALNEAVKWGERLAQMPLMTIGFDKKILRASLKNDFYAMADMESMYQVLTWSSEDFKEGCMAFAEKRKPNFKGK